METNKDNATENNAGNNNPQNPLGGFDLGGFMNDPKVVEIIKHLLSGGGAMAGTYFMWIKPLQDKIEAQNLKMAEYEKRIKELEETVSLSEEEEQQENLKGGKEYFSLARQSSKKESGRKYHI